MARALFILSFIPVANVFGLFAYFVHSYRNSPQTIVTEIVQTVLYGVLFVLPVTIIWVLLFNTVLLEDSVLKTVCGQLSVYLWFLSLDQGLAYRMKRNNRG